MTFASELHVIPLGKIVILSIFVGFKLIRSDESKQLTLQGFLPLTGSGWTGGGACLPAVLMALRHVNERPGLLDGYNLTYSWVDTQCSAGIANFKMFQALSEPPTKIMLLGCGCSIASEATAQVSYLYNLTQLAYGSASPVLSDRSRFPNFFRLIGPDQEVNPVKISLMREFNWKKVATINQGLEFFSMVVDDFVKRVNGTEIAIISQEIFQHDPYTRVENLKNHDARIIVAACYEDKARLLLCAAYRLGLYGPKVVWMFVSWYSAEFWRQNLDVDNVPCTVEEMDQAIDGAFLLGFFFRNPVAEKGIAGITEFDNLYRQEDTYDMSHSSFEFIAAMCYDHVWVAALALNCTDAYLRRNEYGKSLDEFTYQDSYINSIILSCMSNVSLTGVSGRISFGEGADPIKDVSISRIQDGKSVNVGTYVQYQKRFEWSEHGIQWKDGNIPRDSTYVIYEELSVPVWLYVTMTSCSGIGILAAIGFFLFNIIHRDNRFVKLSSPMINNILLLGCVITYCTVFMSQTRYGVDSLCKVRTFCFCLGFTVAFGALFSKTWRVYKIFTNKKLMKMTIKDSQLTGLVCAMSSVVVVILIIWEFVGPQVIKIKEIKKEVFIMGNDAEVRPFVRVCYSNYSAYFSWTIYIIEGALLAFGAFLAWETRHVTIAALNDSRQIGMCVYNVVVLSAVGLLFNLLLDEEVVMIYGITSGCVIIGTSLTQAIVFVPKVMAVYGKYPVVSVQPMERSLPSHLSVNVSTVKQFPSISTNTTRTAHF